MGWLGDSSHRQQGCQAWTAVALPPQYLRCRSRSVEFMTTMWAIETIPDLHLLTDGFNGRLQRLSASRCLVLNGLHSLQKRCHVRYHHLSTHHNITHHLSNSQSVSNSLRDSALSLNIFRRHLKTHLFCKILTRHTLRIRDLFYENALCKFTVYLHTNNKLSPFLSLNLCKRLDWNRKKITHKLIHTVDLYAVKTLNRRLASLEISTNSTNWKSVNYKLNKNNKQRSTTTDAL